MHVRGSAESREILPTKKTRASLSFWAFESSSLRPMTDKQCTSDAVNGIAIAIQPIPTQQDDEMVTTSTSPSDRSFSSMSRDTPREGRLRISGSASKLDDPLLMDKLLSKIREHVLIDDAPCKSWNEEKKETKRAFLCLLRDVLLGPTSFGSALVEFAQTSVQFFFLGFTLHCLNFGVFPPSKHHLDTKLCLEWSTNTCCHVFLEVFSDILVIRSDSVDDSLSYTTLVESYDRNDSNASARLYELLQKYYSIDQEKTEEIKKLYSNAL